MSAPECARCGCDAAVLHLTAIGVDSDATVTDGKFLVNRAVLDEPDSIQAEAICLECGHARYIEQNQWEWA